MTKTEALKQLNLMKEATKGASWEKTLEYAINVIKENVPDEEQEPGTCGEYGCPIRF